MIAGCRCWHDAPFGDEAPEEFTALIEIPKGSRVKYERENGLRPPHA